MNSFTVTCSDGHRVKVERALAAQCPTCSARPGAPCMDMRFIVNPAHPQPRPKLVKLHPTRQDLIRELDVPRSNNVRPLTSVG